MIKNRAVIASQLIEEETVRSQFDMITSQTADTIGEVREISYNLRPYLLDRLGLTEAIKSLLNKVADTHALELEPEIDNIDRILPPEAEMSFYRIIQESIGNVAKHAEATKVTVKARRTASRLQVTIADDGKGFDPNALPATSDRSGGFGLLGVAGRVRMLGGTRRIESSHGKGSTISIEIDLEHNQS